MGGHFIGEYEQLQNKQELKTEKRKYEKKNKMTDAIHKQFAIQQLKGSAVTSAFAVGQNGTEEDSVLEQSIRHTKLQPYTCFGSIGFYSHAYTHAHSHICVYAAVFHTLLTR